MSSLHSWMIAQSIAMFIYWKAKMKHWMHSGAKERYRWWIWSIIYRILCMTRNYPWNHCTLFILVKWSCWDKESHFKRDDERHIDKFWCTSKLVGEAILSANYLLNLVPRKKIDKTPYELWNGWKPSYKFLRVCVCLVIVAVPTPKRVRIWPKTLDCIFIGYIKNNSAYRFLVYHS